MIQTKLGQFPVFHSFGTDLPDQLKVACKHSAGNL